MILSWAVDFNNIGGEGLLARAYAIKLSEYYKEKITVITPHKIHIVSGNRILSLYRNRKNFLPMQESKKLFSQRFVYPLFGFFLLLKYRKKYDKRFYLNYIPLWLFPIFIFSYIAKFHLGPIVGGIFQWNNNKSFLSNFFRVYIMRLAFKISIFFIKFLKLNVLSSSATIHNYLLDNRVKPMASSLNLLPSMSIFSKFDSLKENSKKIDFAFYYRSHPSKYPDITIDVALKLKKIGYKVVVFGEKMRLNSEEQIGYINKKELLKLFKKSKIFVNIADNPENLTVFDAISQGCEVINISKSNYDKDIGIHICTDMNNLLYFCSHIEKNMQNSSGRQIEINNYFLNKQKSVDVALQKYLKTIS